MMKYVELLHFSQADEEVCVGCTLFPPSALVLSVPISIE